MKILWSVNTIHQEKTIDTVSVTILAQFDDGITYLPEGVSYSMSALVTQTLIGKFAFDIVNPIATKIVLSMMRGRVKAFAKIIKQ